jgi:NAD(P)-dependent dehydrogenase (short-subunit alcohol dehydrogenase family)
MREELALAGRVALITGAAGDLGAAIARECLAAGAQVALLDVDPQALERRHGPAGRRDAVVVLPACDIADEQQVSEAVTALIAVFGRLDILVNNAAVATPKTPIGEITAAQWRRAIDVNLTGSWLMARAALPHLCASGAGVVLNIASQLGHVTAPGSGAYGVTKAALIALTRSIAVDHAAQGIRSLSLSPGAFMTNRLINRYGDEAAVERALGASYLSGQVGSVDEVARAALYLISGGRFLNGSDLVIDGGYTAQ